MMYKYLSQNEVSEQSQCFFPQQNKSLGHFTFQSDFANIKYKYFDTGCGINMSIFQGYFTQDTCLTGLEGESLQDCSYLSFTLGEEVCLRNDKKVDSLICNKDTCFNGKFAPNNHMFKLYNKNKPYISAHITFENELFNKLFVHEERKNIFSSEHFSLNFNNHMTPNQQILIRQILNQPFRDEALSSIFIESRILDLVHISAKLNHKHHEKLYLNQKDIQCLYRAKEILLKDIKNPPNLSTLARKSALNTHKLKYGFKELFGKPVFAYLQEYRLNEARVLLENGDISVAEACALVGYKSVGHFSKIFKEHFGVNAIEVKKMYF